MRFSEDRIEKLACSDGIERNIHIWEPEKPKVLFLAIHGGMAHGGDYITAAHYFKKQGFATLAPDLHGHDEKEKIYIPGFDVFLDDLELLIARAKKNYPKIPLIIVGHSMGALIATHFGLKRLKSDPQIKGFIFSSPYYVNAIKTPPVLLKVVGLLSAIVPKMAVPLEDIKPFLTHDKRIAERHLEDEKDHLRASQISARFANETLKAQLYIPGAISEWSHPLYCVVAGDDRIANSKLSQAYLGKIDSSLLTLSFFPENYHENFNELNREEIYGEIVKWVEQRIA